MINTKHAYTNHLSLRALGGMPSAEYSAHAQIAGSPRKAPTQRSARISRTRRSIAAAAISIGAVMWGILGPSQALAQTGAASGTVGVTAVSCGTGGATLLAANGAQSFIRIHNPTSTVLWVRWDGGTAAAAAPSEEIAAGASVTWSLFAQGFLPTNAITCYAASTISVTVEYH